jgi:urea transporter
MAILNATFRGIGQLFFLNSILAGVLIIIGIAFCSRIAAGFALVGSLSGCSPAWHSAPTAWRSTTGGTYCHPAGLRNPPNHPNGGFR